MRPRTKKVLLVGAGVAGVVMVGSALAGNAAYTAPQPAVETMPAPRVVSGTPESSPIPEGRVRTAQVRRVVDGDTVELGDGTRVRLLGIDAPEMSTPHGPASKEALQDRVEGEIVLLEGDPSQDAYDRYGRLLAHLTMGGENVNGWMVRNGWAEAYVYDTPSMYQDAYSKAQSAAETQQVGIWADTTPEPATVYYANCSAARAAGAAPILEGEPGYRAGLDGDGDGEACEG